MTGRASGDCSPEYLSVATARSEQPKQPVRVEGHYLLKNGVTRLCGAAVTLRVGGCE